MFRLIMFGANIMYKKYISSKYFLLLPPAVFRRRSHVMIQHIHGIGKNVFT